MDSYMSRTEEPVITDRFDITILELNDDRPSEGILVRHRLIEHGIIPRSFARVILDEVHLEKKCEGTVVNYLRRETFAAVHMISATPMSNDLHDLLNPLHLLWGRFGSDVSIPFDGEIAGLYSPQYDPTSPTNTIDGQVTIGL